MTGTFTLTAERIDAKSEKPTGAADKVTFTPGPDGTVVMRGAGTLVFRFDAEDLRRAGIVASIIAAPSTQRPIP